MNKLCNILRSILSSLSLGEGRGEALVVSLFILTSCGETIDVTPPDGTVTRAITVQVQPMQSIDNAATRTSVDKPEEGEALRVTFGNAATTRADESLTAAEKVINKAYVVQFNGTAAGSTATWVSPDVSAQLKSGSPINCNFTLSGSKSRVYVIANPKTTPTTGMTLSSFETVAYTTSASLPSTGLPLVASQDVALGEPFSVFLLKSPLAKLTFTTSTGSLTLRGIPSAYSLSLLSVAPGDSPVRPSGITYTATAALTSGTTYYVPANLSGRVDMAEPIYRCSLVAPANSMYVVISANSTTYNVYLGDGSASDFNVAPNYAYNVDATIYGTDDNDLRVGNHISLALDAKGTANCYIAPCANMPCSFDARVMGNGRTTPAHTVGSVSDDSNFPAITPTALAPTSAVVLWETVNTTVAPTASSVVSNVTLSGGRVSFRAGFAQGNAVIAVKNSGGTILWSWHIWRLNETPKEIGLNAIGSLTTNNELVMMDRNLGALSAVAGSDLSIGLQYQWGRKDPMPGSATLASASAMATTPAGIPIIPSASAQYTVAQSIQQPSTFFKYNGDWCSPRTDNLWGTPLTEKVSIAGNDFNSNSGMKSIYDPCPVGWRVPPGYAFANATVANGGTWNKGYSFVIGTMSSYFPASGNRNHGIGTLFGVGTLGNYWMSAPYASYPTYGSYLYFNSASVFPVNNASRGYGYGCRCAKE